MAFLYRAQGATVRQIDPDLIDECVDAANACVGACLSFADESLGVLDTRLLAPAVRLSHDCADICTALGRILARQAAFDPTLLRATLQLAVIVTTRCGDECAQHARGGLDGARQAAEACRRMANLGNQLLVALD